MNNSAFVRELKESYTHTKDIAAAKILVIDDEVAQTELIENVLCLDGFRHIACTNDSRGALSLFVEFEPDIILLDLHMPPPDGLRLLRVLNPSIDPFTFLPIIVLTAEADFASKRSALSSGASDYLTKPWVPQELCLRVRNSLRLRFQQLWLDQQRRLMEREISVRTQELESYQLELKQAQCEIIERLSRAAEQHDDETGQHTRRVGLISFLIAQNMGLSASECADIQRAAPMHDVGKIGVPDAIVLKPGELDESEWSLVRQHCGIGAALLSGGRSGLVQMSERIAFTHHERWDGSGYPRGLKGEEIPLEGRVVAAADVFDALTHERPYKKAWPVEEALAEMRAQSGHQFDPTVIEAFLKLPHDRLV